MLLGNDNPHEAHLLMFPEINTTLKGLSFCQTSVKSFVFERSKTCGSSSREGFSPWPVRCLVLLCWPFLLETSLFIPVFARVLILVVFTEFFPNFSKNSFKLCSLSAIAREWLQIFEDENPEQLHVTLPLVVTITVCAAVPEKLATRKVFLKSDVDAERESVG